MIGRVLRGRSFLTTTERWGTRCFASTSSDAATNVTVKRTQKRVGRSVRSQEKDNSNRASSEIATIVRTRGERGAEASVFQKTKTAEEERSEMFQVFRRFLSDAFRCKKYAKAYEWFRELQHLSDQCEASASSRSLVLDDETYEMGVVAASKALRPKRAFLLLKEMIEEGRTPLPQTFERVASSIWHDANVYQQNRKHWNHPSTRRRRQQRHTEVLHLMMEHTDAMPSKTFYHRCLKSHVRAKKWKVASDLFDRYERARGSVSSAETCDTKAYKLAITASTRMEDVVRSLRLFHTLKRSRAPPSEHTCMELLVVCLHAKRWKDAIGIVSYMKSRSMDVKSAVYATVSETCARAEQWHVAMALLKHMQLDGIEPCEMSELTLGRSLSASRSAVYLKEVPLNHKTTTRDDDDDDDDRRNPRDT